MAVRETLIPENLNLEIEKRTLDYSWAKRSHDGNLKILRTNNEIPECDNECNIMWYLKGDL